MASPEPAAMPCGSCSKVVFFFSKAAALRQQRDRPTGEDMEDSRTDKQRQAKWEKGEATERRK